MWRCLCRICTCASCFHQSTDYLLLLLPLLFQLKLMWCGYGYYIKFSAHMCEFSMVHSFTGSFIRFRHRHTESRGTKKLTSDSTQNHTAYSLICFPFFPIFLSLILPFRFFGFFCWFFLCAFHLIAWLVSSPLSPLPSLLFHIHELSLKKLYLNWWCDRNLYVYYGKIISATSRDFSFCISNNSVVECLHMRSL